MIFNNKLYIIFNTNIKPTSFYTILPLPVKGNFIKGVLMKMTDQQTIYELIQTVKEEMRKLGYSERSLQTYERNWKSFKDFADENSIKYYSTEIGLSFLEKKYQFISNYPVKYTMEEKVRAVNRLDEYYKYQIISTKRPLRKKYVYPEEFLEPIQSYIVSRKAEGISDSRIKAISIYMERFSNHLYDVGLRKISELEVSLIHSFIESSSNYTASTTKNSFLFAGLFHACLAAIHKEGEDHVTAIESPSRSPESEGHCVHSSIDTSPSPLQSGEHGAPVCKY